MLLDALERGDDGRPAAIRDPLPARRQDEEVRPPIRWIGSPADMAKPDESTDVVADRRRR